MKNPFNNNLKKTKNPKKNTNYILQDSINIMNKHLSNLSVSISGEFTFTNPTILYRRFYSSDLEMF